MIDIWCIYNVNLRKKMSQIKHFCGVIFLAEKSGCVKFWTNIMSEWIKREEQFFKNFSLCSVGEYCGILYSYL